MDDRPAKEHLLDGKRRVATDLHVHLPWSGSRDRFRCGLCGHRFRVGDGWRFLRDAELGVPSLLLCDACDGRPEDVVEEWRALEAQWALAKRRFWKLLDRDFRPRRGR